MKLQTLVMALGLMSTVQGQKMLEWPEPTSGVTYKFAIPEASAAPFDILLSIIAPKSAGWAGLATGGCMLRSPLLVAWPNGNGTMVSTRWASAYHAPSPYNGTITKVYSSSSSNTTHWTANFLCSGCSKWDGGSIDPKGNATFGWGVSSHAVDTPTSSSSAIRFHDVGKDHFEVDMTKARLSKADFGSLVKSMGG